MKLRKFATISLLVLSSFAANNVAPSKAELEAMYDKAFKEFNANNYEQALKELDGIDARQPDLAESQNLRGVIYMRQQKYDDAEKALQKALTSDPKFWNARFNLAEIPFLRKNWTEARNRFQGLLFGNDLQLQGEALQLIQYKILLTYLLEGKENMVDAIMAKLELAPDTPAVHYANAAMAFNKKDEAEAKKWLGAAEKNFSPQLNKLFAESIYEVGWMEKPAGQTRPAVELTNAAERSAKAKSFARSKFEQAEQAFQQRDYTAAKTAIAEAEAADSNQVPYLNLRGEILLAQKDFDGAEATFKQALKVDPKNSDAQFNLARVPFKKKDYSRARERFEALFASAPKTGGDKDQAAQLIKFKVYLTFLLEGKDSRAQKMMEQFQFTGDTPALYYAQAAWEFKHDNKTKANDWVTSAKKIYSPAMNMVFADAFYDLGWLQAAPAAGQSGTEVAKTEPAPSVEPTAIPGAALAANTNKSPAQTTAKSSSSESPVPGMEATTQSSPVVLAQNVPKTVPAATSSPSVETPVASTASPAESRPAALPREPEQVPAASQAPVVASNEPVNYAAPSATISVGSETSPPAVASTDVSATPATVLAPAKVRDFSEPTATDSISKYVDPNTLLVGGMLLAGIVILARVAMPAFRNRAARAGTLRAPASTSGPRFSTSTAGAAAAIPVPVNVDESIVARASLPGGPRQVSLQLKATEPSMRRAAVPFMKSQRAFGSTISTATGSAAVIEEEPVAVETSRRFAPTETVSEPRDFSKVSEPKHSGNGNGRKNGSNGKPAEPPPFAGESSSAWWSEPAPAEVEENAKSETVEPVAEPAEEIPQSIVADETPAVTEAPSATTAEEPFWAPIEAAPIAPEMPVSVTSIMPTAVVSAEESLGNEEDVASESEPEASEEEIVSTADAAPESNGAAPIETEVRPMTAEIPPVVEPIPETESRTVDEPIGQGQPIPYLEPVSSNGESAIESAPAPAAPEQPSRFARAVAAGAALVGIGSLRRSPQSPSSAPEPAPEPVSPEAAGAAAAPVETLIEQPTLIDIMAQPNPPTSNPTPAIRTSPQSPIGGGMSGGAPQQQQTQATGGMQTAVQLTFAFEIASLQLTSSFRMGSLQLRPNSRVVSMRLAPSQQPQPAMNLQVNFEVANVQPSGNAIGMIRLTPSQQQRPNITGSSAFNIAGLQLVTGGENAVQLTPAQQSAVQVTGRFAIATVEFSPTFEIAALVLNAASRSVAVQLPGAPGAVESAPMFDIANIQIGGSGEITMLQLAPQGAHGGAPRQA